MGYIRSVSQTDKQKGHAMPVFLPAFAAGVITALTRVSPTVALGLTTAPENPATATRDLLQQLITLLTQDMLEAEKVGDADAKERAEAWRNHVINICADAMRDDDYAATMWVEMEKAAKLF